MEGQKLQIRKSKDLRAQMLAGLSLRNLKSSRMMVGMNTQCVQQVMKTDQESRR